MIINLFYKLIKLLIRIIMIPFLPKVYGKEFINKNNNYIFAGNHVSFLDGVFMIGVTPKKLHAFAKKEIFVFPFSLLFSALGVIPVDREKKDEVSRKSGLKNLENKKSILIFPEGTRNRSKDPVLEFKYGAVSMAKKTNTEIIPFYIRRDYKIFRKRLIIKFGKPYSVEGDLSKENKKLMQEVINLMEE